MLIKKDVFNCSIHPAKLRSSRLPWNSRLSLLVIVNKHNKLHFQYDVCHGLCEGGSSDISSYSSTLLSVSYFTRDSKLLYQFKSKLYLDFASFVSCDQSNLDVNDENSNDSKNKKMIIFIFFVLKLLPFLIVGLCLRCCCFLFFFLLFGFWDEVFVELDKDEFDGLFVDAEVDVENSSNT